MTNIQCPNGYIQSGTTASNITKTIIALEKKITTSKAELLTSTPLSVLYKKILIEKKTGKSSEYLQKKHGSKVKVNIHDKFFKLIEKDYELSNLKEDKEDLLKLGKVINYDYTSKVPVPLKPCQFYKDKLPRDYCTNVNYSNGLNNILCCDHGEVYKYVCNVDPTSNNHKTIKSKATDSHVAEPVNKNCIPKEFGGTYEDTQEVYKNAYSNYISGAKSQETYIKELINGVKQTITYLGRSAKTGTFKIIINGKLSDSLSQNITPIKMKAAIKDMKVIPDKELDNSVKITKGITGYVWTIEKLNLKIDCTADNIKDGNCTVTYGTNDYRFDPTACPLVDTEDTIKSCWPRYEFSENKSSEVALFDNLRTTSNYIKLLTEPVNIGNEYAISTGKCTTDDGSIKHVQTRIKSGEHNNSNKILAYLINKNITNNGDEDIVEESDINDTIKKQIYLYDIGSIVKDPNILKITGGKPIKVTRHIKRYSSPNAGSEFLGILGDFKKILPITMINDLLAQTTNTSMKCSDIAEKKTIPFNVWNVRGSSHTTGFPHTTPVDFKTKKENILNLVGCYVKREGFSMNNNYIIELISVIFILFIIIKYC